MTWMRLRIFMDAWCAPAAEPPCRNVPRRWVSKYYKMCSTDESAELTQRLQHVLCGGRRLHGHEASARAGDGVPQGLPHADGQHERRLAHGLAAEHVVLAIGFGPQ